MINIILYKYILSYSKNSSFFLKNKYKPQIA